MSDELGKVQKDVEIRRIALEDRRAKLAKKSKPEFEEQVKGAEMLLKEAQETQEQLVKTLAENEVRYIQTKQLGNLLTSPNRIIGDSA
jgi:hypothetical protein